MEDERHCYTCGHQKFWDPEAKVNSKASGFQGNRCWTCSMLARKLAVKEVFKAKRGEITKANRQKYRKSNPIQFAHYQLDRKFAEIQATPKWVNLAELKAIHMEAITRSIEEGVRYSVDHIVPLRSPIVCGLNVPWNCQVILRSENSGKGSTWTLV